MDALLFIHNGLFRAGLIITLVIGVWGVVTFVRHLTVSSSYRSTLVLTEALFVLQGLIGVGLFAGGPRPKDPLHWLYGILLVITLPIAATYPAAREERRQPLVYGIAGIFMAGLCLRAWMTH